MIVSDTEIAVIGGGLVGSAIGWGIARLGHHVTAIVVGNVSFPIAVLAGWLR